MENIYVAFQSALFVENIFKNTIIVVDFLSTFIYDTTLFSVVLNLLTYIYFGYIDNKYTQQTLNKTLQIKTAIINVDFIVVICNDAFRLPINGSPIKER